MLKIKIALAQINNIVGDLDYNLQKITNFIIKAKENGADLIIFPETAITSYPCEDLLLRQDFIASVRSKIMQIVELSKKIDIAILITAPTIENIKSQAVRRNSAILVINGEIKKTINKKNLPNYGVFDENRYFTAANCLSEIEINGFTIAILICEDLWSIKNLFLLQEKIIDGVIVCNASPYSSDKHWRRIKIASNFANSLNKPLLYVNQVGLQDNLVFDGSSFAIQSDGEQALQMLDFVEDLAIIELTKIDNSKISEGKNNQQFDNFNDILDDSKIDDLGQLDPRQLRLEEYFDATKNNNDNVNDANHYKVEISNIMIEVDKPYQLANDQETKIARDYQGLIMAVRDYVRKNNFHKVLLGMSGGIDSALVATIAVDALGSKNVSLYALPTRFNSQESYRDALNCAKNLDLELEIIEIDGLYKNFMAILASKINANQEIQDITSQNLQSRIRGNILMALSNQNNSLLLTTGNKSELATGYATIYGDMCGAFNPLKDVYKTKIYQLANYRNKNIPKNTLGTLGIKIPQEIISKEPSAELKENQKDSDSLPDYHILDQILEMLIEKQFSTAEIINKGFDVKIVQKIAKLLKNSEYKRRQAVIGPKISDRSFDKDWRYPIINGFNF